MRRNINRSVSRVVPRYSKIDVRGERGVGSSYRTGDEAKERYSEGIRRTSDIEERKTGEHGKPSYLRVEGS